MDCSLGFAAGVMIAASYWSLLAPAIELAEEDPLYGKVIVPPLITTTLYFVTSHHSSRLLLSLLGFSAVLYFCMGPKSCSSEWYCVADDCADDPTSI